MKKRNFTGMLFALTGVSLLGVGFSAWVIQGNTAGATQGNVTVNVGETTDQRMTLTAVIGNDNSVRFDAASDDVTGPIVWDGTNAEDLTFGIDITIKNALTGNTVQNGYAEWFKPADVKMELTCSKSTEYDAAIKGNCIVPAAPTAAEVMGLPASYSTARVESTNAKFKTFYTLGQGSDPKDLTIKAEFSFGWGTAFGSKNPSLVDPSGNVDSYMTLLKNNVLPLNGATFTATFSF